MIIVIPEVSNTAVTAYSAATTFTTDSIEFTSSYNWCLQITLSGTDANPLITIERSNNDTNWDDYSTPDTSEIEMTESSISFEDTKMTCRYLRVHFNDNGITTGNVSMKLILKGLT